MSTKKILRAAIILLIALIIVLGTITRFGGLKTSPSSANFDEAALGYNAYSLMKTGKDEYGRRLPISLRSFNDYKPALYSYLSIIPIKFHGLDEISTRFVSALAGSLGLILLLALAKKFVSNNAIILVFILLASFSPWGIHFSRVAFESNLSAFFFLAGSFLLLTSTRFKNMVFSIFFLALSAYSYHSARLAAPILVLLYIVDPLGRLLNKRLQSEGPSKKEKIASFILLMLLIAPLFLTKDRTLILTRLRQTNLYYRLYPFVPQKLLGNNNPWLNWSSHPLYYLGGIFLGHIVSCLSPRNFLLPLYHWIRNSPQAIPEFSMLGPEETLLWAIGLILILKRIKENYRYRHLLYWIVAGSLPAALTWTWFHPLRSLNIFPAVAIVFLLGLDWLYQGLKKHLSAPIIPLTMVSLFAFLLFSRIFIINNELVYSSWETHGQYQPGGFKEGVPILARIQDNYQEIVFDSPHAQSYIFLLFYQAFPPEIIQQYADQRPKPGTEGNLNFDFEKYTFRKFDWPKDKNLNKTIFWTSNEIKPVEILKEENTAIIQIENVVGNTAASIITKK